MPCEVQVDWAPIYELLNSLATFESYRRHAKTLELPAGWAERIRHGPKGDELARALGAGDQLPSGGQILIWQCPDKRSTEQVLSWVAGLSPNDICDRLMPYAPAEWNLEPRAIAGLRDNWIRTVELWDEIYFHGVAPAVLRGLGADADAKRDMIRDTPAEDVIEAATGGVRLEPTGELHRVVLVPQYHFRPWNIYTPYRGLTFYHYPVDAVPPAEGEVPPAVARLTRALADESRLQILRYLAAGPRGFKDIVQFADLAKSTVHHHMVALRAAGLVRVHWHGASPDRYSLRPDALTTIGSRLVSFIKGE